MKKIVLILLSCVCVFLLAFSACEENSSESSTGSSVNNENSSSSEEDNSSSVTDASPYKVYYYFENEQGEYALNSAETISKTAEVGTTVTAPALEKTGYEKTTHDSAVESGVIKSGETLVLKAYYRLKRYNVAYEVDGDIIEERTIIHGKVTTDFCPDGKEEYEYTWKLNGVDFDFSTPITSNIKLVFDGKLWGGIV